MDSSTVKKLFIIAGLGLSVASAVPTQPAAAQEIVLRTGSSHHERREIARERAREREIARERAREREIAREHAIAHERRMARREARERYYRRHHHYDDDVVFVP